MLRARIAAQLHKQPLLDSSRRCLHSSGSSIAAQIASGSILHRRARLSSTPSWSEESLAAVRDKYEQKYAERLQQKARENGFESVEQLKANAVQQGRKENRVKDILSRPRRQEEKTPNTPQLSQPTPPTATAGQSDGATSKSPVKPLSAIVDLPKLLPQSKDAIGQIWNAYHQMQANALSAAIPAETYLKMQHLGKQYPQFVVPLPREVKDDQGTDRMGAEMHFLQWSFLPSDAEASGIPGPSTVLFTPLAHYQAQQTFAQPHVILTHYTDLINTHGIVLMKGDLTDSVSTKINDAHLLVLRLQQFYQGSHALRTDLLKDFHERPAQFDVQKLVDSVGEV